MKHRCQTKGPGLDADLLDDDALRVGGAAEGVALVLGAEVGLGSGLFGDVSEALICF